MCTFLHTAFSQGSTSWRRTTMQEHSINAEETICTKKPTSSGLWALLTLLEKFRARSLTNEIRGVWEEGVGGRKPKAEFRESIHMNKGLGATKKPHSGWSWQGLWRVAEGKEKKVAWVCLVVGLFQIECKETIKMTKFSLQLPDPTV